MPYTSGRGRTFLFRIQAGRVMPLFGAVRMMVNDCGMAPVNGMVCSERMHCCS